MYSTYYLPGTKPYEVGTTIIPILYMKKLEQRKIKYLAQSSMQASVRVNTLNPGGLAPGRMIG